MTADDFKEWRRAMGFSREEAAYALGLSKPTIENYESGRRRGSNRPVVIPKPVALACAAIYHCVEPWPTELDPKTSDATF
ncbi:helix-turn-helix transcriptional regulator [Mesorhizobium sp. YR577]|uniref:helix-turn-helix domain-containing protein n=1 Tax=Mesorhizobium sp. YR577 TaxID=1884373 RepID=UPI0008E070B0|nr:helix-turn-helix transcriptional regulator [Mesorhizobium sp. YR577]SFU23291.1 Helix-turn-helix domain-containing protein [Mesorhizobium sp. YR577]